MVLRFFIVDLNIFAIIQVAVYLSFSNVTCCEIGTDDHCLSISSKDPAPTARGGMEGSYSVLEYYIIRHKGQRQETWA